MNKLIFYRTVAIVLLVINLVVIGFVAFSSNKKGEHPHDRKANFRNEAVEILDLDKSQEKMFFESADRHNKMMNKFDKKQSHILQKYFRGLNEGLNNDKKEMLLTEYNELERRKIEGTYNHFEEIKGYLKSNQIDNYNEFVNKAVGRLLSNNSKPPHPPKNR